MKKVTGSLGLAAMLVAWGSYSASANVVTLTFEGLADQEPINNYYNGGTGGFGSGPGPNYGVTFTPDSLALIAGDAGGTGNFNAAYLPSSHTAAYFLTGTGDTMNVAGGFNTGFSFFYSAPYFTGSVSVYSGQNGTGTLLATLTLGLTDPGKGPLPYDDWEPVGVTFAGTAQSAIFSGTANYIAFDNITLGSQTPGGVPDGGASALLLGMGLMCLAAFRRMA